jgi:hypothetical protein
VKTGLLLAALVFVQRCSHCFSLIDRARNQATIRDHCERIAWRGKSNNGQF